MNNPPENVYTSAFGVVLPRYLGALSATSSAGIIYLISISEKKFQIVYHRIMAAMSVADILSSIAIGLTTLPMPSPEKELWTYRRFEGTTRLGNIGTCEAQGFFFIFGTYATYGYNVALCIYYACAIAFHMQEGQIKKKMEIVLHALPLGSSVAISVPLLFMGMYNPSNGSPWCTMRPLPNACEDNPAWPFCIRGMPIRSELNMINGAFVAIALIVIIVSLYLVNRKVYLQNKMLKKYVQQQQQQHQQQQQQQQRTTSREDNSAIESTGQQNSLVNREIQLRRLAVRTTTIQSMAYVAAFIITIFFEVLFYGTDNDLKRKVKTFFRPLQGFFNFLIFAGSKLVLIYWNHPNIPLQRALKILFYGRGASDDNVEDGDLGGNNFISEDANSVLITGIHFVEGEDGFIEPYFSSVDDIDWIDRNNFSHNTSSIQDKEKGKR